MGSEVGIAAKKSGSTVGNIIMMIIKIFAYFILAIVLIAILGTFFGLGIAAFGLLPLKTYLLETSTQNLLAWGTVLLFIWVPVVGIIVWVIRKITGSKSNSNMIRLTFIALWTLGWVCAISLLASVSSDFRVGNNASEINVPLTNPGTQMLEVKAEKSGTYYSHGNNWFHLDPFASFDGDTAFVKNISIRIIKSSRDSFEVKMVKQARGQSSAAANERAGKIQYNIYQNDSLLILGKGIAISKENIFRNQNVIVTIAVPVGKRIKINDNAGRDYTNSFHMDFGNNDNGWDWYSNDDEAQNWHQGVEYVMTNNGLKAVRPEDEFKYDNNYNNDGNKSLDDLDNELNDIKTELQTKENEKQEKLKELEQRKQEIEDILKNKRGEDSTHYQYKPPAPAAPASDIKQTLLIPKKKIQPGVAINEIKVNPIVKRFSM